MEVSFISPTERKTLKGKGGGLEAWMQLPPWLVENKSRQLHELGDCTLKS